MVTSIPYHLSVHEINQHKLYIEYKHWVSRLSFFDEEMDFYVQLLSSRKFEKSEGAEAVFEQISSIRNENKDILRKIHSYRNNLENYRECEDLECDNFYLNDHEKFRVVLEQHSANIRDFKSTVFKTAVEHL